MGQAKKRGTYEERVRKATARKFMLEQHLTKADSNCEPFLDNLPLVCIVLHGRN